MGTITEYLTSKQLISPPQFLKNNIHFETIMGSNAYGVSSDSSDNDIYGFCIPPKHILFPHISGYIIGFGNQPENFEQYQQHHIEDKSSKKSYDVCIYNIIKYFHLCMKNNPNMIDSLFVPRRCITHISQIGEYLREKRKEFLHKGCWHKFKGYAFSQMHKMNIKNPEPGSKRYDDIMKHGFDVKFAYHVVRLLLEVEQILIEGDLDLERNREQLKAIRRGEWTQQQIIQYFTDKEKSLEQTYLDSKLPYGPDENKIKNILLNCLEMHYGSLGNVIETKENYLQMLDEIQAHTNKIRNFFQNKNKKEIIL